MNDDIHGHRQYQIKHWNQFLKRAQKQCLSCDHYYDLIFTMTNRWVKGHFCLHYPILYWDYLNTPYLLKEQLERLIRRPYFNSCVFYRNRNNKNHPYNNIRKNKDYYDMSAHWIGQDIAYRKIPNRFKKLSINK